MAYIHKETFEILNDMPDDWKDDYFECDELIAPVIRALNLKGYKTAFCCAGHAYSELGEAKVTLLDKNAPPEKAVRGTYYTEPLKGKKGWHYVKFKSDPTRHLYISFENGTVLPAPPKGFEFEADPQQPAGYTVTTLDGETPDQKPTIYKDFSNKTSDYSFYRSLLTALRCLLEWAEGLPNLH